MQPKRPKQTPLKKIRISAHPAVLLCAGLLAVFVFMLMLSETLPYQAASPAETSSISLVTPSPTSPPTELSTAQDLFTDTPQPTATVTPLPPELLANSEQTFGIIIGTVLLVILVIGGSLVGIWARRHK